MKKEVFEEILHCIRLPLGEILRDGKTYRITSSDFHKIKTRHIEELKSFDKMLVLTSDQIMIVGGVLFYGASDIQATIFPEYRGQHFMSTIHKNGVLKSECYPRQKVTISIDTIDSFDDFLMKRYLLSCAGLRISNLSEIHKYFNMFKSCTEYKEFQEYSRDDFVKTFS